MTTDLRRYCVFCDKEVQEMNKAGKVVGEEPTETLFVHVPGVSTCGRNAVPTNLTYTEGTSDGSPSDEG